MSFWRVLLSILFPPLAVIGQGCGSVVIVLLLTLCGWVPGVIAALVILNNPEPLRSMKNKNVKVADWGSLSYEEAWQRQEDYFSQIIASKRENRKLQRPFPTNNYLFLVAHPPVFTIGKSGKMEHLLLGEKQLETKGISFFKTNRGGDITFHGPGQIVGYPLLDLDNFFTDIHRYLRCLEEVIIKTLADFGIVGARSDGETGVWLDLNTPFARKICAMGVRASRWVTMHGFAFNVNTDLSYFDYIVPCGIQGKGVTSLAQELKKQVDEQEVKDRLLKHFTEVFEAEIIN